jgi:DNA-binding winged helix-turn-helix (wHTH) protein
VSPFESLGETARWRILYGLLSEKEVDSVITYEEMAEALKLDAVADRHSIQVSMRRAAAELEKVNKQAVEAVVNVGYRIVEPEEHLRLARSQQRKSSKALVRGHSKAVNVDLSGVDPEIRNAFQVVAAAFAMQMDFNKRTDVRQKKLEDALEKVRDKSARTGDEVAELRARLERLEAERRTDG